MRLYAGRTTDFIQDATRNNIARRLESAFVQHFRYRPSPAEVRSWEESLSRLGLVVSSAKLTDHGIFLEYQLPQNSRRIDALITGADCEERENAVIVELKQWQKSETSDADAMVTTWLGGQLRDTLHPSVQAQGYRDYLADMHSAFHEEPEPVLLSACAYLHNYRASLDDPIRATKFQDSMSRAPLFDAEQGAELAEYLVARLDRGHGIPILQRIEESKLRPSKKLLDHISAVVDGEPRFILLDEQRVVFERALAEAKRGFSDLRKRVVLVQGGPGTGKSVLAANLLGKLSKAGLNTQYTTGSMAFTQTLRKILGSRAAAQLTYSNNYTKSESNSVDILICDEAHRIREKSTTRFMKAAQRASMPPQIHELLNAAKVSVFFIDDLQVVRPGEAGSAELIRTAAKSVGADLKEYQLEAQFRCAGSDAFVNWVDNTLDVRPTANQIWNRKDEAFDFRIFRSAEALDLAIRERTTHGSSARLVAGFCWPWSKALSNGSLVDDVVIGEFRRPWNAKPDSKRLAAGIPKAPLWAYEPGGINQVGCVYTAQGFEFDYVGVIWGRDLRFDSSKQKWLADRTFSKDKVFPRSGDGFAAYVRSIYRVLLSRGLKGCYVYCEDEETAKFLLSRCEGLAFAETVEPPSKIEVSEAKPSDLPLKQVPLAKRRHFQNCIPVYDLRIAAGTFGDFQVADPETSNWVQPPQNLPASIDLFVARIRGESMNRVIPDGAWCVFRRNPVGTRNHKIVVAQVRNYSDPDNGGAFTIKRYESIKRATSDGYSENTLIRLKPESTIGKYKAIEIAANDEDVWIVAEFIRILT
jgi:DUF2075 family protein